MKLSLRQATDDDFAYCESLSREHMAAYRKARAIAWDPARFRDSWSEFENLLILADGVPAGSLRLTEADTVLEIRDLQVQAEHRNRGIGAWAVAQAHALAVSRHLDTLRLRVFTDNPARGLYARLGFSEVATHNGVIHMSLAVPGN